MFIEDDEDINVFPLLAHAVIEEEQLANQSETPARRRGSIAGRNIIQRNKVQGHERLYRDYFHEPSVYPPNLVRRRFRMNRSLFLRINYVLEAYDPYFIQKRNAAGTLGLSYLQKVITTMRMHWKWKNFPTAWQGMYTGHIHQPTIILEVVASQDSWIWHAFFGLLGSLNDNNVLERSSVFRHLDGGRAPSVNYSINGHDYTVAYYLGDGIYHQRSTSIKTILSPQENKNKYFAQVQEAARKDVERAFWSIESTV